ncbi:Band 7/SPFH domain superfamily [Arabidopsis thaliana x Arabidopsis arenosa]|uniref:Band 7/SPFH domain superfamily n=1 Tax=Arabidopsis thaliana x Arabidopsis arenosa TaxID=1240361 RepID=A0A8T1XML1_9BRAS|nr:Band 7/SPFH domain superfamily [Arabidopsis thaliana x Arabidopsis arenosa]
MAETRSMLLNEAVVRETEEVLGRLEKTIAEQNQMLDESFAKLIGAIRLISDNVNDVSSCGHLQQKRSSPDGKELVKIEVATKSIETEHRTIDREANADMILAISEEGLIPQFQVSDSDSEILSNIKLREEKSVLEDLGVMNENLEQEWDQNNVTKRFEVEGDVERGREVLSITEICCAHQMFGKMSTHEEKLGIKKTVKGFKSWMFKYKSAKGKIKKQDNQGRHDGILRGVPYANLGTESFMETDSLSDQSQVIQEHARNHSTDSILKLSLLQPKDSLLKQQVSISHLEFSHRSPIGSLDVQEDLSAIVRSQFDLERAASSALQVFQSLPLRTKLLQNLRKKRISKTWWFKFKELDVMQEDVQHVLLAFLQRSTVTTRYDIGEHDEMFKVSMTVSVRCMLGLKCGVTVSDASHGEKDVYDRLIMVKEQLSHNSLVIQEVFRNNKIKFSKRWWFKYKSVEEGFKRLSSKLCTTYYFAVWHCWKRKTLPHIRFSMVSPWEPVHILERTIVKRQGRAATKVLVQWANETVEEATWEFLFDVQRRFPNFEPCGQEMGNTYCLLGGCIDQASVGVVERWGRFEHIAEPGCHFFNPLAGQWLAGVLSTRINSLDVKIETKTKDNVFVQLVCSIQYRVVKGSADDAFYELQNPKEQIQAYVFDVVRALVPMMTLDALFEQKGEVAKSVLEELEKVMGAYGYSIEHILMVDILPDPSVRKAMNEINAAQRLQLASVYKGEAEKILQVKRAEAEAEAKYLGGVGVARQRQAITDGLRENILNFSDKVEGTSAKEVMDLIMITQYFDTIRDLGNSSKNTTVFLPHGPGHVRDISDQIRNGMMEAAASAPVNDV